MMEQPGRPALSPPRAGFILAILYGSYLLSYGDRVIFAMVLKPVKTMLGLTDAQLGLLSGAALALSYAFFSPIAGHIVDRRTRRIILAGAVAFWSAMTFTTGFMTTFLGFFIARIGVGAGEAFLHPLAVSLVADTVAPVQRPRAFGIYMSATAMGTTMALLLGGTLVNVVAHSHGVDLPLLGMLKPWGLLFVAAGVAGFIHSAVILILMREPPREMPVVPLSGEPVTTSATAFLRGNVRLATGLLFSVSFFQMASFAIVAWQIAFFERVHGMSAGDAGVQVGAVCGVASLVGCFAMGRIIAWLRRRGHADAPLLLCMISGVAYAVFAVAALLVPTTTLSIVWLAMAQFWVLGPGTAGFTMMGEIVPTNIRAGLTGVHSLINGLVANSLGTFLVGLCSDRLFPSPTGIASALVLNLILGTLIALVAAQVGRSAYRAHYRVTFGPANAVTVAALKVPE